MNRTTLPALALLGLLAACDDPKPTAIDQGPGPSSWIPDSLRPTPLVIEEIAPGNATLLDERGEDPGWVEVSNTADTAVPLGAWVLRGEVGDGPGWRLPDTTLPPGGRILVFCSGLDRRLVVPAGDTAGVFNYAANGWSDSLNDPPGHSTFGPWEIAGKIRGRLMPESLLVFSSTLVLNDPAGTGIEWSSVEMSMATKPAPADVSGRDRLRLRATLPAGQPILMRFCEEGQECWKGATLEVVGTGERLGWYDLSVHGVATDFAKLVSVTFTPPTGRFGTYRLTVADLRFYRSARWPHASFELHRKGGVLHLEDTSGTLRQSVAYPAMPATSSWARVPGTRTYVEREQPTPATANPADPPPAVLPAPAFATATGYHAAPVLVRLGAVAGAVVRCSENGARLDPSSPDAADGIRLDSTRLLTCAAFDATGRRGPVATGLFLVGERAGLPVVSLSVDSAAMFDSTTGLYMEGPNASIEDPHYGANYWQDTELPAHVEFFEKDGTRGFSEPAGLGIFGNWSRAQPKRPLSVQFREKYGTRRVDWPLFPQHPEFRRFKGFGLRNMGGDYASGFSRDALGTALTEGRGLEYQLSRMVAVYLNGRYWGMYDMREKLDPDYLDTRFGLAENQVDLLKNGGEVQAGTATDWNRTVDWFLGADLSDSASMATARTMLDVDDYATYAATEMWASNDDWPANNLRSWRKVSPASPWRMMLFDLDGGLAGFSGELDMFAFLGDSTAVDDYPNGPRSTVFFRKLSANPGWRARFVHRFCVLLATNFSPARAVAVLDSMQAEHAAEKVRDRARWNIAAATQTRADTKIRSFLKRRPADVLGHMQAWYSLGDTATVALSAEGGSIEVEGLSVGDAYRGVHFEGVPMTLEAKPSGARAFAGWSDGVPDPVRVVVPGAEGVSLSARFR